jgi:hypothetical protein
MASTTENKSELVTLRESKVDAEQPALEEEKGPQDAHRTVLEVRTTFSFFRLFAIVVMD